MKHLKDLRLLLCIAAAVFCLVFPAPSAVYSANPFDPFEEETEADETGSEAIESEESEANPTEAESTGAAESEAGSWLFSLADVDTRAMSNYMNFGELAVSDPWRYGLVFDDSGFGCFGKIKQDGTEKTFLSAQTQTASCIELLHGWIYCRLLDFEAKQHFIVKMRLSGEDESILAKPEAGCDIERMFVHNGNIYYTENNETEGQLVTGHLLRMDLNGENKETILDKAVYYPYGIGDRILYQDDRDDFRMHICGLNGEDDQVLIDDLVFGFVTDGTGIIYQTYDMDVEFDSNHTAIPPDGAKIILKKYDPETKETEILVPDMTDSFAVNEGIVYYCNEDDSGRLYSFRLEDGSVEMITQSDYISIYGLDQNGIYYYDRDANNEYIEDICYIHYDGTEKMSVKR